MSVGKCKACETELEHCGFANATLLEATDYYWCPGCGMLVAIKSFVNNRDLEYNWKAPGKEKSL